MRDIISSEIKTALINRASDFHIIIDEVNLVRREDGNLIADKL